MPTLLSDEQVTAALTSLDEWSGSVERISRTVSLPAETGQDLRQQVSKAADALDHHPVLEGPPEATTYIVWTHTAGGVTALDIRLAARIDELIREL
jgi:4a-hydroxytetrahydrobiopterin dehydratase